MTPDIGLIGRDAATHPKAFVWYGALPIDRLKAWAAERSLRVPGDLMDLWSTLGAGEMFESEEILVPYDGPEYAADFDGWNERHHAAGLPAGLFVFHEGTWLSAVRAHEPCYVTLNSHTYAVIDAFSSLQEWYEGTVRKEFAERYGLGPEEGPRAVQQ